jgi:hypothetical protein
MEFTVKTDCSTFVMQGTDKLDVINRVENQLRLQSYWFGGQERLRDVSPVISQATKKEVRQLTA